MDWRTFISQIVASVAWPTVIVGLVLLLRRELVSLLGGLRRVRWRELEAEFDAGLERARDAADTQANDGGAVQPPESLASLLADGDDPLADRVLALARLSPRSLIMESWRLVEHRAREVEASRAARPPGPLPGRHGP